MELLSYEVKLTGRADHRPVVLAPIGDIQWAGKRGPTAADLLKRHIDHTMELGALYVGLGDYIDFMSPSNRQRFSGAALYDTALDVVDDKALELTYELYENFLKVTKGRWVALCHGHHWAQLRAGDTTDMRLAQMLGATFVGTSAYVRLVFTIPRSNDRNNVTLWMHHGCGGGQKAGAPLGKIEDMAASFPSADIYLMGHTTKSPAAKVDRIIPRWHGRGAPDLEHKTAYLVNTGGFSRSYAKGATQGKVPMGLYPEQGMMRPAALGAPIVRITPWSKWQGSERRTWAPEIKVEI